MKKCPFCGADIEESARFCLYCMQSLTEKEQILLHKRKKPQWIIIAAIAAVFLIVAALWFNRQTPPQSQIPSDDPQLYSTQPATQTGPSDTPPVTEPPHIHSYTEENTAKAYQKEPATCMTPAVFYYSCLCGEKGSDTFSSDALGEHITVTEPGYPATCETPGVTDKRYCFVCQVVLSPHQESRALGHTYTLGDTSPTCLVCEKKGPFVITDPVIPCVLSDALRVDSCTYTVRTLTTDTWRLTFHVTYTNITSENQSLSVFGTVYLDEGGRGIGFTTICNDLPLKPNESGECIIYEDIPKSETLILKLCAV